MTHIFDTDIAVTYGVEQAIMIANYQFWIGHNAANNKNYHDNKFWTFNSYSALTKIFPYWSEKQVRRIVGDLVSRGVLEVGNFNKKGFDKTNWYAFVDEAFWIKNMPIAPQGSSMCPNGQTVEGGASAYMGNSSARSGLSSAHLGTPIPDTTNTDNKHSSKHRKNKTGNGAAKKAAPHYRPPGVGDDNGPLAGVPPVAQPPRKKLYTRMCDVYEAWHMSDEVAGAGAIWDATQGQAMVKIVAYFKSQAEKKLIRSGNENPTEVQVEDGAVEAWQVLLAVLTTDRIEDFLKKQIKITQILSNLSNIIYQLKNGNKTKSAKPAGSYEHLKK